MNDPQNNKRRPARTDQSELALKRRREGILQQRKASQKRAKRRRTAAIILVILIVAAAIYGIALIRDRASERAVYYAQALSPVKPDKALEELSGYPAYADAGGLSSKCVLLYDMTSGKVICERNAAATVKIASLTKIMTAVVAIENIGDMNAEYTMSAEVIDYLRSENSAVAGFAAGERVTGLDLLYAAMLPSGGDGAMGLADLTAGSQEAFVAMMNAKAKELGLHRTYFTNVTGFDDADNYSCAYDVSLLFEYALQNDLFRRVITTPSYTTTPTAEHPGGIRLRSTVYSGFADNGIEMGSVIGGKTGYTYDAGRCLATYAVKDGEEYILVTLGAGNTPAHFRDAFKLYSEYVG